jgi:hypothetical protein
MFKLSERYFYAKKNITADDGNTFELKYYFLKSGRNCPQKTYGVEISKHQAIDGLVYTEVKSIENLCYSECAAMLLLRIISDGAVTPMFLEVTLDEMRKDERFSEIFTNSVHKAVSC